MRKNTYRRSPQQFQLCLPQAEPFGVVAGPVPERLKWKSFIASRRPRWAGCQRLMRIVSCTSVSVKPRRTRYPERNRKGEWVCRLLYSQHTVARLYPVADRLLSQRDRVDRLRRQSRLRCVSSCRSWCFFSRSVCSTRAVWLAIVPAVLTLFVLRVGLKKLAHAE